MRQVERDLQDIKEFLRGQLKLIDEEKYYSIAELSDLMLFPTVSTRRLVRDIIVADYESFDTLGVKVTGEGTGRQYSIKGSLLKQNLPKFYDRFFPGWYIIRAKQMITNVSKYKKQHLQKTCVAV